MKNFTHRFRLIAPGSIAGQWKQQVTLKEDASPLAFMATDPVSFTQEVQSDDSGIYYSQNFSAVVSDPAVMAANRRRAVVEMTLSDGSVRYIGTKEDAPVISVTPYPDRYVVSCECLSVEPVEL